MVNNRQRQVVSPPPLEATRQDLCDPPLDVKESLLRLEFVEIIRRILVAGVSQYASAHMCVGSRTRCVSVGVGI